jgi:hypothetical protein
MVRFDKILFFLLLFVCGKLFAQLSLDIDPINQVLVGGGFQISGRIVHDANSTDITAGTPILLDIEIQDPSGNPVSTNPTQVISGGFSGGRVENFAQSFQMPWSEDDKWNGAARWRAVVTVSGGGSPSGNITFPLVIPDLSIDSVTTPVTAEPGSLVTLEGTISNPSIVATEAQRFFRIEASIVGSNITESIIFPDPDNFPANSPWPIQPNVPLTFTIPNFYIPPTSTGTVQVQVSVDPSNPDIVPESNQANNSLNHNITITTGDPNIGATVFFDSRGTYQGLDPIKFKLVARNIGNGPIDAGQNFDLTVALSQDNQFSNDDFILREIDVGGGGNALGLGLRPNETITVDWVQMLPDNFEGDFYVIVSQNRAQTPIFSSPTPEISLRSENSVNLSSLTANQASRSSRPTTDRIGNYAAFESFQNGQMQIFVQNINTGQTVRVTNAFNGGNPNGSSYAPVISADGRYVVFHSLASNLVPGDNNNHSDIFLYEVSLLGRVAEPPNASKLSKISNSLTGSDSNAGSFYPSINSTGSRIVFESEATNLTASFNPSSGKQIFTFDQNTTSSSGVISQLTAGNADSFDASIDGNGTRIVFTTHATNLVTGEQDTNGYADVILWENNSFYFAGRSESGALPIGNHTIEPVLSEDGSTIAFRSSAPNMVTQKGISYVEIMDAGLGYTNSATVLITDSSGIGAQASVLVNTYGEISGINIDNPGEGYVDANITIIPDPVFPAPTRQVAAKPRLVNPLGDVFRITVDSVKLGSSGRSFRISESPSLTGSIGAETGGNERSREPSISSDGSLISYSSRANNLLDLNLTATDQNVYPNLDFRSASAQAILHGGIGKIIVANPGSGYPASGVLQIQDLSGNGSGAVVTYKVDSNGGIGSIDISNPGSGYDLTQTIISVQNPGTGTGFQVGQILFPAVSGTGANRTGGASIHRVEMVDSGIGYPQSLQSKIQTPIIIVDGDGIDTDGDGQADSRVNPDRIHFGQNGEVYLEQQFEITLNSLASLSSTTLQITDYLRDERGDQPLVFSFDGSQFPTTPLTVSTADNNLSSIRDSLITMINNQWANPNALLAGPLIDDNLTNGFSFTLKALSGRVNSNNPSALGVVQRTNMLVQGSGFSRATAQVLPSPVVHGFSEMATGQNTSTASNGRPVVQYQDDFLTDDIYLYNHGLGNNQRISVNKFGFPTNYLATASMPSHRFSSISGDGRYILFSSDAGGLGGIVFNNSNQQPEPATDNTRRDIFIRDLKTNALPVSKTTVKIQLDIFKESNYIIPQFEEMPIIANVHLEKGYVDSASLYVDNQLINNVAVANTGLNTSQIIIPWVNIRQGNSLFHVVVQDNFGNLFQSSQHSVEVVSRDKELMGMNLILNPSVNNIFSSDANITRGSSIGARFVSINSNGKLSNLKEVVFFLNGKKIKTDKAPPYFVNFSPPSYAEDNSTYLFDWVVSVKAVSINGSSRMEHRFGRLQGIIFPPFPESNLKIISNILKDKNGMAFQGQPVELEVSMSGSSESLLLAQQQHFFANGIHFFTAQPNLSFDSNGNLNGVKYFATFDLDYEKFSKPNGNIELFSFGDMNTSFLDNSILKSNSLVVSVSNSLPWVDPITNALNLFDEFSDSNLTGNHIEKFQDIVDQNPKPLIEWIRYLTEIGDFDKRIDIHSAYHIVNGNWHDSYVELENDLSLWVPIDSNSSNLWLRDYIDSLLSSQNYISKFGTVPFLVGAESMKSIHNFGQNRRSFAELCLKNKYASTPSFLQMNQGASKMLNYWAQFEPDYWELPFTSTNTLLQVDSPPRRDAFSPPISLIDRFSSGIIAVDFIYELTIERKINGLPYILYTEDYRDNYFKIGALMAILWGENAFPIDQNLIQLLKDQSFETIIDKLFSDSRYTSRYNFIWSESDEVPNAPDWKRESWFGYFMDSNFPWVFHEDLGWIYIAGVSPTQFWFYSEKLGWLWTGSTHYPALYSGTEKGWIYFDKSKSAYYSYVTNSWKSF